MTIPINKRILLMAFLLISIFISFTKPGFSDVVVIINPANDTASMKAKKIKKFFLNKKKKFTNGVVAIPVEQTNGSPVREVFNAKVLKKSASQLKAYWARVSFSGKGSPPKILANDSEIKAFVAATVGAISYIDSSQVDDSVKIILTIK